MTRAMDTIGPPRTSIGMLGWLRRNLFSTWYNTGLTLVSLGLIFAAGPAMLRWTLTGAHWTVIAANLRLFMVGGYPPDQVWRVWLVTVMVSALFGLSGGVWGGTVRTFTMSLAAGFATLAVLPFEASGRLWLVANMAIVLGGYLLGRGRRGWRGWLLACWPLSFILTIVLLHGLTKSRWLPEVSTTQWGGLLLTFMIAAVSIVACFPIGVLLALGRRSRLPAIRVFCICYIEVVRGVPLVTILYMAEIMLPLFLPGELRPDNVVRAIAGMTLSASAYMAENVRGGLQAIPGGQVEAAHALGLNNALVTVFIVLPQALRMVIPASVGLFISLFKDTTLIMILGLFDLLSVGRSVLAQPQFMGLQTEVYLFVGAIFFVFSYAMSFASYRLEAALGVGKR